MKVWISKFALTKGIFQMEVRRMSEDNDSVFGEHTDACFHGEGKEWHKTEEEAKGEIEAFCLNKITSIANAAIAEKRGEILQLDNPIDIEE